MFNAPKLVKAQKHIHEKKEVIWLQKQQTLKNFSQKKYEKLEISKLEKKFLPKKIIENELIMDEHFELTRLAKSEKKLAETISSIFDGTKEYVDF